MAWEVRKLGDVCEYDKTQGSNYSLPYVGLEQIESNTGVFLGTLENQTVKSTTFHFTNNHVLYGRLRPYLNKVLLPDFEGHCSTEIFPILPKKNLDRSYLAKWLMCDETVKKIDATSTGARMPRANMNHVLDFEIPTPPLAEQKRIVTILDEAFSAISTAKDNAEKNLKNAKELFESYLNNIFEKKGKDWEEKKLGEVAEYVKISNDKNLPYVGLENIESGTGKFMGSLEPLVVKSSTFYFTDKHVLYGRLRPYLNKVLLPEFEGHCSTEIFPILAKRNLDRRFLSLWLMYKKTMDSINATCTGARMPRANMNAVLDFVIPLPPLMEQQRIVAKLDALSEQTKKLEAVYTKKIADLDELKKSILQKAFRGEL